MFTGLVTHQGRVREARAPGPAGALRLVVEPLRAWPEPRPGESVAVDGVCLTVVEVAGGALAFDVVPETLRRTTLGERAPGARVNLEGALRVGDALGGHWVQGHVDGVAEVLAREARGAEVRLVVGLPRGLSGGVLPKGSVALDGVSLTVGEVWPEGEGEAFSVYLIPHTLAVTTLGAAGPGTRLNVELDPLGRWVEHHLARLGLGPAGAGGARPASR